MAVAASLTLAETAAAFFPPSVTPAKARAELVAATLDPTPLFPSSLPARLGGAGADLKVTSPHFRLSLHRRLAGNKYGGSLSLERHPLTDIEEAFAFVRARGGPPPRAEQVGDRHAYFLCGHVCGYYWSEQGFSYSVAGQYFEDPEGADEADMRAIIRSLQPLTSPWPFPLNRPVASAEAQAYMPLLFLDDDEHWPLSDPDWFLHSAAILQCPKGAARSRCRSLSLESMQDPTLDSLRFDPEDHRTGARPVMFVNQTEPGQPAVEGGPPINPAYRVFDYWWYYSFNRAPYGATKYDHLSDWEGATVVTRPGVVSGFDFVVMSAHTNAWSYLPGVLRCGEGLEADARHETHCLARNRVNVYAAEGTHANYPRRCGTSLLEFDVRRRRPCLQTGLSLFHEVPVNVPEGRFNGNDDAATRITGSDLKTFVAVGPWDWTRYRGSWHSSAGIPSPPVQQRFRDPIDARVCTRRWDGPNEEAPCDPSDFGGARPSSPQRRARSAQTGASADPCETWFGPLVQASACQPDRLRASIEQGRLSDHSSLRVAGAGGQSDTALGVAQLIGDPLTPNRPVRIFGEGEPADVRIRGQVASVAIEARFDDVALSPQEPMTIAISPRGALQATTAQGVVLRPSGTRRTNVRRPPQIKRASARRISSRLVVRYSKVPGRVVIDLLATRAGTPLRTVQRPGMRGRAILTIAGRRPRYVALRRLSRGLIPGASRVVIIR